METVTPGGFQQCQIWQRQLTDGMKNSTVYSVHAANIGFD